jgi:hypothetical protein
MLIEIRAVGFQRNQLFINKAADAPTHIINFRGQREFHGGKT